ncbi:nuclease A inhibitor family protein [Nostoc sp.]|uniref:nuclease A inhibitor family protein n=1 Tax=Nostoc sp. TaxID=1180 RepID=UPI002FF43EF5
MSSKKFFLVAFGLLVAIVISILTETKLIAQSTTDLALALALYHAPIHYQDTDSTKYSGDYITRFDYDNDWRGTNNWDNLILFPLSAHAYYSVAETCTHWFITYSFYHPQDWTDIPFEAFLWSNQAQEPITAQKLLQLTGYPQDSPIEEVELEYFFRNCAFEQEWHNELQKSQFAFRAKNTTG